MNRHLQAGLLALCLCAAVLAGCGGEKTAQTMAPAEATALPTAEPTAAPTAAPAPTAEPTAVPTATPEPTPEPTPAPTATPEPTPEGPTPTPVAAGSYTYKSAKGTWKLQLRDDGLFTLTDPDGGVHTGESWITDTDGTVLCGPTDIYFEDFAFSGGCSRWTVSGKNCSPVMP